MARKKKKASLLSADISGALKAVCAVAFGFVLTLLGLLGITALFSYYPLDTSLNTAGGGVFSNALGLVGASIADALWQGLGLAAILIPIAMVLWGSWLTLRIHPRFVVARILTAIFAVLFFAAGFAGFEIAPSWPVIAGWGGVLGFVLFGVVFRFLDATGAEQAEFLAALGLEETGLARVIRAGYDLLGLHTFFTSGPKESRAWTIKKGATAPEAAGAIHSDFEKGFIRAEIVAYNDYITLRGEARAREAGKLRSEGKNYVMKDGDVAHFLFNV